MAWQEKDEEGNSSEDTLRKSPVLLRQHWAYSSSCACLLLRNPQLRGLWACGYATGCLACSVHGVSDPV